MTLTLLFDLDDTLLDTHMEDFIPAYFKALAGHLASRINPERMLKELMVGTRFMLMNESPDVTLRETFNRHFYPALGIDEKEFEAEIDRFYDEVFPTLGRLTHPRPIAVELIEWAFAQGHRIVIATNPLFPLKAIHHRMRWAGLPPEKYPFALVTSFEHMHFTKSFPAYYAEILARLNWPEGPVVMIGDDEEFDVQAGRGAGLTVFSLKEHGGLDQLRPWLEQSTLEMFKPDFKLPSAQIASLQSTPAALDTFTRELNASAWTKPPAPDAWCATEIVCHLRDADREINLPRVEMILKNDNPFIAGQNPDVWAAERKYIQQDGPAALKEFMIARAELIAVLKSLPPDALQRPARHAIFGPTTLQELIGFMVTHDQLHIQQITKTLNRATP
jgi:FMN phosphatase YigB (HAD superfamily)